MENITNQCQRLVHIDLKGSPPRLSYFKKILPFIRNVGATGILLEWEDTFPYTDELECIGAMSEVLRTGGSPYTKLEAIELLRLADEAGLEVVPLVQTFGHMEFVLKHERWRTLREVDAYPSSMCPSNSASLTLVQLMVSQILNFHTGVKYLHIGADEIWHMGYCQECRDRMADKQHGEAVLYLEHVTNIAKYIKTNWPNISVIMWDDMLRNIDVTLLNEYNIGALVEPMVWHYAAKEWFTLQSTSAKQLLHADGETVGVDVTTSTQATGNSPSLWTVYGNVFSKFWVASAFKGASGSSQIIPEQAQHVSNHVAWLEELEQHASKVANLQLQGIALTGWSRYDHYSTMCELLPNGLPSLVFCLKIWLAAGYSSQVSSSVFDVLTARNSDDDLSLEALLPISKTNPKNIGETCRTQTTDTLQQHQFTFPGWKVYMACEWFIRVRNRYRQLRDGDALQSWMNSWQLEHNYTNPMHIAHIHSTVRDLLDELGAMERQIMETLSELFYVPTVDEWMGTLITPLRKHLQQMQADCEIQMTQGCRPHTIMNFKSS